MQGTEEIVTNKAEKKKKKRLKQNKKNQDSCVEVLGGSLQQRKNSFVLFWCRLLLTDIREWLRFRNSLACKIAAKGSLQLRPIIGNRIFNIRLIESNLLKRKIFLLLAPCLLLYSLYKLYKHLIYIYIYIYREKERQIERQKERERQSGKRKD